MAIQTFPTTTYKPLVGSSSTNEHRARVAEFGNGYSQRSPDGINSKKETWNLTYRGSAWDMDQIAAFFNDHAGYQTFLWSAPIAYTGQMKVFVKTWRRRPVTSEMDEITCTFVRVYDHE